MANNIPNRPQPQQGPQKPQQGRPRRRWLSMLFYIAIFAIIGYYFFGDKDNRPSKEVNYTDFKTYVENGMIDAIEVGDNLQATGHVAKDSAPSTPIGKTKAWI